MLTGPNFEGIEEVLKTVSIPVIASGGIGKIEDVQKLLVLKSKYKNLVGAITGKAIYEGTLDFAAANALCTKNKKSSLGPRDLGPETSENLQITIPKSQTINKSQSTKSKT